MNRGLRRRTRSYCSSTTISDLNQGLFRRMPMDTSRPMLASWLAASSNLGKKVRPGTSFLSNATDSPNALRSTLITNTTVDQLSLEYGPPAFIFMDIEGMEYQCLKGPLSTMQKVRPIIFTEVNGSHLKRAKASVALLCNAIRVADCIAFDVNDRRMPQIDLDAPEETAASDWLL